MRWLSNRIDCGQIRERIAAAFAGVTSCTAQMSAITFPENGGHASESTRYIVFEQTAVSTTGRITTLFVTQDGSRNPMQNAAACQPKALPAIAPKKTRMHGVSHVAHRSEHFHTKRRCESLADPFIGPCLIKSRKLINSGPGFLVRNISTTVFYFFDGIINVVSTTALRVGFLHLFMCESAILWDIQRKFSSFESCTRTAKSQLSDPRSLRSRNAEATNYSEYVLGKPAFALIFWPLAPTYRIV